MKAPHLPCDRVRAVTLRTVSGTRRRIAFPAVSLISKALGSWKEVRGRQGGAQRALWPFPAAVPAGPGSRPKTSDGAAPPANLEGLEWPLSPFSTSRGAQVTGPVWPHRSSWKSCTPTPTLLSLHLLLRSYLSTDASGCMVELGECRLVVRGADPHPPLHLSNPLQSTSPFLQKGDTEGNM